ncbi:MAG: ribonuclease HII [Legionellales bacterium]|nr:MAG: ribonuclease HII [Legionellales bacterium]
MLVAGVDEAGRGPLAGPVVAAAVILDPQAAPIAGLTDSKKLSRIKREELYDIIMTTALAWGIAHATAKEIDSINILQATMLAMQRAVQQLSLMPELILVDGNRVPNFDNTIKTEAIIGGDLKIAAISAASILAKVSRDRDLITLDKQYPEYNFAQHKGYPTKAHIEILEQYGPCPAHRISFAPVRRCLENV